jgi:hypothetical protein
MQARPYRRRARLWLCIFWFAATFSPAANIFFYPGLFIAERVLYLPSLAYSWLLAEMLCSVRRMFNRSRPVDVPVDCSPTPPTPRPFDRIFFAAIVACIAAMGWRTRSRNMDWSSQVTWLFTRSDCSVTSFSLRTSRVGYFVSERDQSRPWKCEGI